MGESAFDPAEYTEPSQVQPVSVVELYEQALRMDSFYRCLLLTRRRRVHLAV